MNLGGPRRVGLIFLLLCVCLMLSAPCASADVVSQTLFGQILGRGSSDSRGIQPELGYGTRKDGDEQQGTPWRRCL